MPFMIYRRRHRRRRSHRQVGKKYRRQQWISKTEVLKKRKKLGLRRAEARPGRLGVEGSGLQFGFHCIIPLPGDSGV